MKLIETRIVIGKASDCEGIDDAHIDGIAQRFVALAVKAGWDRSQAIAWLINEPRLTTSGALPWIKRGDMRRDNE